MCSSESISVLGISSISVVCTRHMWNQFIFSLQIAFNYSASIISIHSSDTAVTEFRTENPIFISKKFLSWLEKRKKEMKLRLTVIVRLHLYISNIRAKEDFRYLFMLIFFRVNRLPLVSKVIPDFCFERHSRVDNCVPFLLWLRFLFSNIVSLLFGRLLRL